jgi:hypothetical protein
VVGALIHPAEPFGVDQDRLQVVVGGAGNALLPDPEALGAWVDGGAHLEARLARTQQHAIHEEALACAVLAHDADGSNLLIFGDVAQELLGFGVQTEAAFLRVGDERHRQFRFCAANCFHQLLFELISQRSKSAESIRVAKYHRNGDLWASRN